MPKLAQLRPLLRDRLRAHPTLASLPVLLDDLPPGQSAPALEDALRDYGVCLSLPPLLSFSLPQPMKTPSVFSGEVEIAVHLRTQPATRARLASAQVPPAALVPVEDLLEAVLCAGAAATPSPGSPLGIFQPAAETATLVIEDVGCVTYAVRFTARLTLASRL